MGCGLCKQNGKDAIQPKLKSGSIDDFDHPDAELDLNEGEDQEASVVEQPRIKKQRTKAIPVITAAATSQTSPNPITRANGQKQEVVPMSVDVVEKSEFYNANSNQFGIGCIPDSSRPPSNVSSRPISNFPSMFGGTLSAGQSLAVHRFDSREQQIVQQGFDIEISQRSEESVNLIKNESQKSGGDLEMLIKDMDF